MNIVMIADNDPAGMGIAFANAINLYTEHTCRLVTCRTVYNFDFQKDIHIPDLDDDGFDEIVDILKEADILHFHILADEHLPLGSIHITDFIKGKALLHHHHGHPDFRSHPEKYRDKYRRLGRRVLVSTPDLLRLMPEAGWQPNLVPIEEPEYAPPPRRGNGRVRVCHTPTRKDLKNTAEFLEVMVVLQKRHPHMECVMVENTPHRECLRIRRNTDIVFDHMQGYFGVSSLEGLSQGKPVIAGLDRWNIKHIQDFSAGHPFHGSSPETRLNWKSG